MFICRAAGFEIKGHLDTVHASYEKVLAEEARKSGEYRRRGWYGTLNAKDLLEEKAVLENRLKDLRNAQADVEVFNRSVQEAGRHIRAIFSDPSKHQRPFLIVFEKDPLKWPLKKEAVAAVTNFLNAVQRVELWLVQKWAKLYPKAKHAEMVGFDRECDTAAVAIYRLNSVRYDIKADLEDCEKRLASVIRYLQAPAKAQERAEKKRRDKARQEALLNRQRNGAQEIRVRLSRDHPCPYCGGPLGSLPQADHIHPVAKGGLSTIQNMVYICVQCNNKKSHMTLTAFAAREGRDLPEILKRLRALGKEF